MLVFDTFILTRSSLSSCVDQLFKPVSSREKTTTVFVKLMNLIRKNTILLQTHLTGVHLSLKATLYMQEQSRNMPKYIQEVSVRSCLSYEPTLRIPYMYTVSHSGLSNRYIHVIIAINIWRL